MSIIINWIFSINHSTRYVPKHLIAIGFHKEFCKAQHSLTRRRILSTFHFYYFQLLLIQCFQRRKIMEKGMFDTELYATT